MHTTMQPPLGPIAKLESDHRIANNLGLLAALLELDGGMAEDAGAVGLAEVLYATRRRIYAVANIHRRLQRTDREGFIEVSSYLDDLGHDLRTVCQDSGGRRHLSISAETLYIAAEDATSLGILVAELVSNACKHAYPDNKPGEVRIALASDDSGWQLTVEDDGIGFSESPTRTTARLGAHLIDASAAKLDALYIWQDKLPGTRFTLWCRNEEDSLPPSAPDWFPKSSASKERSIEPQPLPSTRRRAPTRRRSPRDERATRC